MEIPVTNTVTSMRRLASAVALALLGGTALGCNDFLTSDEAARDPNRPNEATANQLWVGVQTNLWAYNASDPVRIAELWAQHAVGGLGQYASYYNYGVSESTTNGFYGGVFIGGGLVDIREIQRLTQESGDSLFYGIAQVAEANLIGTAADLFGDIVYSQALQGNEVANPPLDEQLAVYDAVQAKLDSAIVMMAATGVTNVGPASADLAFGGDPAQWTKLAYTLKARYYLHTAEVRPEAYASALEAARNGMTEAGDAWIAPFSGGANEQNFWYLFAVVNRADYWTPDPAFVALLESRGDPRRDDYFNEDGTQLSDERLAPNYVQPLVTANENLLIQAEAAARTNLPGEALDALNAERALVGLPALVGLTGNVLLREILTEKYIATFQTLEAWNDYKRTCFPNLAPVVDGRTIPARLYYDTAERQTNSSIPEPALQPVRNDNDPANATDPFGAECLGQ